MRPIRRILVAIKDPSAKSLPAVTKGAQLARAFGAHLDLFHGIATPLYIDTYSHDESIPEIERKTRTEKLEQLELLANKLRQSGLNVSTSVAWDFPVYEAVVRRANRDKADLIIAECHGKPHIMPGLLHLTDWELLRASTVPVLLVKTPTPYRRPVVLAAVDPAHAFSKPAKLDDEILRLAKSVSQALRGPLHAVHAYVPMPTSIPTRQLLAENAMRHRLTNPRAGFSAGRFAPQTYRRLDAIWWGGIRSTQLPRRHAKQAPASSSWAPCRAPGSSASSSATPRKRCWIH
jgi:nucleotide-binding universal stress UspA family protein